MDSLKVTPHLPPSLNITDKTIFKLANDVYRYAEICVKKADTDLVDVLMTTLWMTIHSNRTVTEPVKKQMKCSGSSVGDLKTNSSVPVTSVQTSSFSTVNQSNTSIANRTSKCIIIPKIIKPNTTKVTSTIVHPKVADKVKTTPVKSPTEKQNSSGNQVFKTNSTSKTKLPSSTNQKQQQSKNIDKSKKDKSDSDDDVILIENDTVTIEIDDDDTPDTPLAKVVDKNSGSSSGNTPGPDSSTPDDNVDCEMECENIEDETNMVDESFNICEVMSEEESDDSTDLTITINTDADIDGNSAKKYTKRQKRTPRGHFTNQSTPSKQTSSPVQTEVKSTGRPKAKRLTEVEKLEKAFKNINDPKTSKSASEILSNANEDQTFLNIEEEKPASSYSNDAVKPLMILPNIHNETPPLQIKPELPSPVSVVTASEYAQQSHLQQQQQHEIQQQHIQQQQIQQQQFHQQQRDTSPMQQLPNLTDVSRQVQPKFIQNGSLNFVQLNVVFDQKEFSATSQEIKIENNSENENKELIEREEEVKSRFVPVDEEQMKSFEEASQSKATKKNTRWGLKIVQEWHLDVYNTPLDTQTVSADDLAVILRKFYCEARPQESAKRKQTLGETVAGTYSKNTLKNIRSALNRHFSDIGRDIDIIRGHTFKPANRTLDGLLKDKLRSATSPSKNGIDETDLSKIYTYFEESRTSPIILRQCVWFNFSLHFGSRGLEFNHRLKRDSLEINVDQDNVQYVTLNFPQAAQSRNCLSNSTNQPTDQRMYATGGPNCPVATLMYFLEKSNPYAEYLFNNCIKEARIMPTENDLWFGLKPMGERSYINFMSDISLASNCAKCYKGRCLRKTAARKLKVKTATHTVVMPGNEDKPKLNQ